MLVVLDHPEAFIQVAHDRSEVWFRIFEQGSWLCFQLVAINDLNACSEIVVLFGRRLSVEVTRENLVFSSYVDLARIDIIKTSLPVRPNLVLAISLL